MSFTIDTSPVDEAAAALAAMADRFAAPELVLRQVAAEVARLAGPATPRATGRLAASVSVAPDTASRASVRWGVPYAVYVNYGTRVMPARPFATAALKASEDYLATAAAAWAADIMDGA